MDNDDKQPEPDQAAERDELAPAAEQPDPSETSPGIGHKNPPAQTQPEPDPSETLTSVVALVTALPEPIPPAGFDYDALGPELAQATRARVANIHEQNRRVRDSIFVIGMEGVGLRDSLPYGVFMQIVADEYGQGYWDTLNRCINVYERLGDPRFRILRNLRLNDTTLYAMAMKSTPEWVRCEIADGIENGTIPIDKTLNAEVMRRLKERREGGVMPPNPSTVDAANARRVQQRDYAIAFVRWMKANTKTAAEYAELNGWISRAGPEFDRIRQARTPEYLPHGFVSDTPINPDGTPLTDRQLQDHLDDRDSTPPEQWEEVRERLRQARRTPKPRLVHYGVMRAVPAGFRPYEPTENTDDAPPPRMSRVLTIQAKKKRRSTK